MTSGFYGVGEGLRSGRNPSGAEFPAVEVGFGPPARDMHRVPATLKRVLHLAAGVVGLVLADRAKRGAVTLALCPPRTEPAVKNCRRDVLATAVMRNLNEMGRL